MSRDQALHSEGNTAESGPIGTHRRRGRTLVLNVLVYVVMNGVFVMGWWPNIGKPFPAGFFWPVIPIVAWGVGLLLYARHQPSRSM